MIKKISETTKFAGVIVCDCKSKSGTV